MWLIQVWQSFLKRKKKHLESNQYHRELVLAPAEQTNILVDFLPIYDMYPKRMTPSCPSSSLSWKKCQNTVRDKIYCQHWWKQSPGNFKHGYNCMKNRCVLSFHIATVQTESWNVDKSTLTWFAETDKVTHFLFGL